MTDYTCKQPARSASGPTPALTFLFIHVLGWSDAFHANENVENFQLHCDRFRMIHCHVKVAPK